MKSFMILFLASLSITNSNAQNAFSKREFSVNGFRNPSIGAELRYKHLSVHAGYYPTNFKSGSTTSFIKTGLTYWFFPVDAKQIPSSFYGSLSLAKGLSSEYQDKVAGIGEVGFRWMFYKGFNLRLGIAALAAKAQTLKVNPTPGISYSFSF
jgi:hypothetical protein